MEKPRIGVYVCWCGTNIAKMVDVEAVAEELKEIPNVIVSRNYKYMCSDPGQDLIMKDIKENNLNRIVVSACSPRIHELTFRKVMQNAGLNPYMFQMANIREHCSWVHTDREEATRKAKALITAAINRVNFHEPLNARSVEINPATMVIGGGIAGISAALEIAEAGKKVYLIEKTSSIGGQAANINATYPFFESAQQMLHPLINKVETNNNIEVLTNTGIKQISGYIGNFESTVIPANGDEKKLLFGNIVIATGLSPWNPSPIGNYGYGKFPDVITSPEFEKMLVDGKILKKNGETPKDIAIIHCVGSRNKDYHEYCSRICCTVALKFANQIRSALPDANIYELYADMRSMSKGCEELYASTSQKRVMFMMFDQQNGLPLIRKSGKKDKTDMIIELDEIKIGKTIEIPADMVILMVNMEAREDSKATAHFAGVSLDKNNFFIEKHPKLDPVATTTNGVFIVGSCNGPKDIPESIMQARAAAARILGTISRGTAQVEATTAYVQPALCVGCQMCISICPYTAIGFDDKKNVSVINEVLCQGCGTCVALCRPRAINIHGCTHGQLMAELNALLLSD